MGLLQALLFAFFARSVDFGLLSHSGLYKPAVFLMEKNIFLK